MTTEEKLDDLRRDNAALREQLEASRRFAKNLERGIDEAYGRIAALEEKLKKSTDGGAA